MKQTKRLVKVNDEQLEKLIDLYKDSIPGEMPHFFQILLCLKELEAYRTTGIDVNELGVG